MSRINFLLSGCLRGTESIRGCAFPSCRRIFLTVLTFCFCLTILSFTHSDEESHISIYASSIFLSIVIHLDFVALRWFKAPSPVWKTPPAMLTKSESPTVELSFRRFVAAGPRYESSLSTVTQTVRHAPGAASRRATGVPDSESRAGPSLTLPRANFTQRRLTAGRNHCHDSELRKSAASAGAALPKNRR